MSDIEANIFSKRIRKRPNRLSLNEIKVPKEFMPQKNTSALQTMISPNNLIDNSISEIEQLNIPEENILPSYLIERKNYLQDKYQVMIKESLDNYIYCSVTKILSEIQGKIPLLFIKSQLLNNSLISSTSHRNLKTRSQEPIGHSTQITILNNENHENQLNKAVELTSRLEKERKLIIERKKAREIINKEKEERQKMIIENIYKRIKETEKEDKKSRILERFRSEKNQRIQNMLNFKMLQKEHAHLSHKYYHLKILNDAFFEEKDFKLEKKKNLPLKELLKNSENEYQKRKNNDHLHRAVKLFKDIDRENLIKIEVNNFQNIFSLNIEKDKAEELEKERQMKEVKERNARLQKDFVRSIKKPKINIKKIQERMQNLHHIHSKVNTKVDVKKQYKVHEIFKKLKKKQKIDEENPLEIEEKERKKRREQILKKIAEEEGKKSSALVFVISEINKKLKSNKLNIRDKFEYIKDLDNKQMRKIERNIQVGRHMKDGEMQIDKMDELSNMYIDSIQTKLKLYDYI